LFFGNSKGKRIKTLLLFVKLIKFIDKKKINVDRFRISAKNNVTSRERLKDFEKNLIARAEIKLKYKKFKEFFFIICN